MNSSNNGSSNIIIESGYVINSSESNTKIANLFKEKTQTSINNNQKDSINKDYQINNFIKIIGKHDNQANFIKELKNFNLITSGTDNKLILYNMIYKKLEEKKIDNWIFNIDEIDLSRNYADKDATYQIICNTNNKILYFINNKNDYLICKHMFQADSFVSFNFLEDAIICTKKGINFVKNLFCPFHIKEYKESHRKIEEERQKQKMINYYRNFNIKSAFHRMNKNPFFPYMHYENHEEEKNKIICKKTYKSGIRINNILCAFTSNSVDLNGEDNLIIYSILKNKILYEAKNYSFTLSPNNLFLISKEIDEGNKNKESNYKLLLSACKKYKKNQKNGILLIKIDVKNENFSKIFYNTGNYEVFCFCHILNIKETGYIFKNEVEIHNTNYILVGGFDVEKGKGILKLYKILYDDSNFLKTKIEYIQDIDYIQKIQSKNNKESFQGFKGPISCICQSKKNGNVLISCWDGNVYLFSPPNIEYFDFYDQKL